MVNDFIFELGCEELPSASVRPLADEFTRHMLAALDKAQLSYGQVKTFATPRRIGLMIAAVQTEQESQLVVKRGPAVNAAFDANGNPAPALTGFAKSCGVPIEALTRLKSDKGEWMVYESHQSGAKTNELLVSMVKTSLNALPVAKPMRWGDGDEEFVRPVHWVVMLFGDEVIETQILGVHSGRDSAGHRFHAPENIFITSASTYEKQLKESFVIADFGMRRELIKEQIQQIALPLNAIVVIPEELLDEVTSIVEWPQALLASFDKEFLEVPPEALIASMQVHQKCFALKDQQGALLPHFITVSNISSSDPEQVIRGNEKVMRARLSDAAFFLMQDKKNPLSAHIAATERVVFQIKLGSLHDKVMRVQELLKHFINPLQLSLNQAQRAVQLSKCDLMTGMVGEFPELQGLMGYYYALHDGEDLEVAKALNEQYMPRFAADVLPPTNLGKALSLADRLDTLVGIFGIGEKPTGVKDPFKLRRHALAVARMLIAIPAPLSLSELLKAAKANYKTVVIDETQLIEIKAFILERLHAHYQALDIGSDLILAVRASQDECLYDMDKRLKALSAFIKMPEAASLSAACKRVNNLLDHAKEQEIAQNIDEQLLERGAEQELYSKINLMTSTVALLYQQADYEPLLKQLASLKEPVDTFFDKVMVMIDDRALRSNRLTLLARLRDLLQGVAHISLLHWS